MKGFYTFTIGKKRFKNLNAILQLCTENEIKSFSDAGVYVYFKKQNGKQWQIRILANYIHGKYTTRDELIGYISFSKISTNIQFQEQEPLEKNISQFEAAFNQVCDKLFQEHIKPKFVPVLSV